MYSLWGQFLKANFTNGPILSPGIDFLHSSTSPSKNPVNGEATQPVLVASTVTW